MGLVRPVIRILTKDQHLGVGKRRQVKGGENLVVGWVDGVLLAFCVHETLKVVPVRFAELAPQQWIPVSYRRHELNLQRGLPQRSGSDLQIGRYSGQLWRQQGVVWFGDGR